MKHEDEHLDNITKLFLGNYIGYITENCNVDWTQSQPDNPQFCHLTLKQILRKTKKK